MSIINTQVQPFKAQAFHNGKFIEITDHDLKNKWSVVIFMPAAFTFNCPTEVEDVIYASGLAGECVALGIPHPVLGQGIVVVATAPEGGGLDPEALLTHCKQQMPQYMVPTVIVPRDAIPRSPNGKMDRKALAAEQADRFKDLPA